MNITSGPIRIVIGVSFAVIIALLSIVLFLTKNPLVIAIGSIGLVSATIIALLPNFPQNRATVSAAAIMSGTYRQKIPPEHTFPVYQIPPENDIRADVRLGCAPLLDCAWPLLLRAIAPEIWVSLARSHAINVDIRILDFSKLFDAVRRHNDLTGIDIAIASAISVDHAHDYRFGKVDEDPPVAILPILQQFTAYYLFARRSALREFLHEKYKWAVELCDVTDGSGSLASMLKSMEINGPVVSINPDAMLLDVLKKFEVHVERGADLDAALVAIGLNLAPEPIPFRYAGSYEQSVQEAFNAFVGSTNPSLFMGGIAQTAYLKSRAGPDDEFVILLNPEDFQFKNLNSLVASKLLAETRGADIYRFLGWWFDALNRFRRLVLHPETRDDAAHSQAIDLLMSGASLQNQSVSFVPADATRQDVEAALSMIRIRSGDEVGSYLPPNIHAADSVKDELTERLRGLRAVIDLLHGARPRSESTSGEKSGITEGPSEYTGS